MSSTAPTTFARPLEAPEERVWTLERLLPGSSALRVTQAFRLRGSVRADALGHAFEELVHRHRGLRTAVSVEAGAPRARPVARTNELLVWDVRDLPVERRQDAALAALREQASQVTPDTGDLLRLLLVQVDVDKSVVALAVHRLAADEWTAGVLWDELGALYDAACRGAGRRREAPVSRRRRGAATASALAGETILGVAPLNLPSDRLRPEIPSYRAEAVSVDVSTALADALARCTERARCRPLVVLLAALEIVLWRYTRQETFAIGTTLHRDPLELGAADATFPILSDVADDPPFEVLLDRVGARVEAAAAGDVPPLAQLSKLGLPRDPSRHPVFQVTLATRQLRAPCLEGVTAEPIDVPTDAQLVDLALELVDGRTLRASYATDLFDHPRIERLFGHLEEVVRAGAEDQSVRLSRVRLLTALEERALLGDWQGGPVDQPDAPLHRQIADRAALQPDALAAVLGEETLTYGQLVAAADALARRLRALGVGREDVVAVALEPGLQLLVALVGILRSGGAFVVVDRTHPLRRLEFMFEDTRAKAVITRTGYLTGLPQPTTWAPVCVDALPTEDGTAAEDEPLDEIADATSLAYVLYTSGSTGQPKGVLVEHHALTTFLAWLGGLFDLGPSDRILQHMALVFDFSVGEIFTALTRGATLVFVPENGRRSPGVIGEMLERERITYAGGPPPIFGAIEARELPHLRAMVMGGEAFSGELVNRWNDPPRRFVNGYGPTEAAVGCIFYECEHRPWSTPPPIGRPMAGRTAYVLDADDQLCPVGVPGAIVVGGRGIARGYLNNAELTRERFDDDPYRSGGRMYRTGDLGVWTEDGQIQFLGRIDAQVKLNGLRIELEEIESALAAVPGVAAAAVAVGVSDRGSKHLVAYVVPENGPVDDGDLRAALAEELPAYMLPSSFVRLDALPLTPVGKIDRAALPSAGSGSDASAELVPPQTREERLVAAAFAEAVGVEEVGADSDFFALGGTSLDATSVASRLGELTKAEVPVRLLYTHPTVRRLATMLARGG